MPLRTGFQRPLVAMAAVAILFGGCVSGLPRAEAAIQTSAQCEGASPTAYAVSRQPSIDPSDVVVAQAGVVKINEVIDIAGPCADRIMGYRMGSFAVEGGGAFAFAPDQGVIVWERARDAVKPADLPAGFSAPVVEGDFISAVRVSTIQTAQGLEQRYVGLWRDGDEAVIADFVHRADGSVSAARHLLRSQRSVNGVTYMSAPDTNTGRLSIVQALTPGQARVVSYETTF